MIKENVEALDRLIKSLEELEKIGGYTRERKGKGVWGAQEKTSMQLKQESKVPSEPARQWTKEEVEAESKKRSKEGWPKKEQSLKSEAKKDKKDDEEGLGHARDGEPMDATNKAETLSKPPVSEAQRRAMFAAASGKSTLGIPKSVGKEFADADEGGKLPDKKDKAGKAEGEKEDGPMAQTVYHDGNTVTSVEDSPHSIAAQSKLLVQNYAHEKSVGRKHYYRHILEPNKRAIVFAHSALKKSDDDGEYFEKAVKAFPKKLYHIHNDGEKITDKPMSLEEIHNLWGGVKRLEAAGHILVPHEEKEKDKAEKAAKPGDTLNYKEINKPASKDPDAAHGLKYGPGGSVEHVDPVKPQPPKTPGLTPKVTSSPSTHAAMQEAKIKGGKSSHNPPTALEAIKERQKMKKSEVFGQVTTETLTKSMREKHTDAQITEMLKAACDEGMIHRNVLLEWLNYKTINPALINLVTEE